MTPNQQNEAIAKWMGWTKGQATVLGSWISPVGIRDELPDYVNDLNAMSTAETKLRNIGGFGWTDHLRALGHRDALLDMSSDDFWQLACAPARERSEALLKALNLWQA